MVDGTYGMLACRNVAGVARLKLRLRKVFGALNVGWVLWAELGRLRFPSGGGGARWPTLSVLNGSASLNGV